MVTYVVSGASRGLGLEFVKQLSTRGDTVYACARDPDQAHALQQLVDNKKVFAVKLDVTCEKSIKESVKEISEKEPQGIDILINNAGICLESRNPEQESKDQLLRSFETNVVAVIEVTNSFLPLLRKRGDGNLKKILNITSALGSVHNATDNSMTSYRISKNALNMLTKLQSNHLAEENFVVYGSHPGWCKTDMGGENAMFSPEDSIKQLLKKLDSVKKSDSGIYVNVNGDILPN